MHGFIRDRNKLFTGFTIVELIIVIVVIAILATLTFIAYGNVQTLSQNAKTIANVQEYYNALEVYQVRNGTYPATPDEGSSEIAMVCLGVGYPDGTCGKVTGTVINESPDVMAALQKGSGSNISGVVSDKFGVVHDESFIGAVYGIDSTDTAHSPTGYARMIEWFLAGKDQDCKIPRSWAYNSANGNTACELDLEPYQQP